MHLAKCVQCGWVCYIQNIASKQLVCLQRCPAISLCFLLMWYMWMNPGCGLTARRVTDIVIIVRPLMPSTTACSGLACRETSPCVKAGFVVPCCARSYSWESPLCVNTHSSFHVDPVCLGQRLAGHWDYSCCRKHECRVVAIFLLIAPMVHDVVRPLVRVCAVTPAGGAGWSNQCWPMHRQTTYQAWS